MDIPTLATAAVRTCIGPRARVRIACRVQVSAACPAFFVRLWSHGLTRAPSTASVVCRRVPPSDEKPLREVGRNARDNAGGLRVGSVSIAPNVGTLLSGEGIRPTNLPPWPREGRPRRRRPHCGRTARRSGHGIPPL